MTPKEEAKELYNMFNPHALFESYYGDDVEVQSTKQCALIAVDAILKVAFYASNEIYEHYIQVKQEIEKL
jgi:hypothetical protein